MSECHSFGSNYHCCSQSRKISVGVLVDSPKALKAKGITQAVKRTAENTTSGKENLVEDRARHTPSTEKNTKDLQNGASPWVSTKSFNIKLPSSVAVQNAKLSQNFPVATKTISRSKRSKKASVDHSVQPLGSKRFGLQSYKDTVNNLAKISSALEAGKISNAENVENVSSKSGFLPENDLAKDKNRKPEPGGSETLRMKLWEIIANVSSPEKQSPNVQPIKMDARDFNPELEEDGKENPNERTNPHSDTIESDSERPDPILRIPSTHYLTRKKASSRKQHSKIEASKIASHKKQCQEKSTVSVRGDSSRRPCETVDTGFLPCNSLRNKGDEENFENPEERWQSWNKSKSILTLQTSILHGDKAENGHSANDMTRDILRDIESGTKIRSSFEFPNNVMTEQPNASENGHSSNDRRDILKEIESGTKIRNSFESPNNVMTEQPSAAENGHSSNDRRRDILREIESGTKIRNSFESLNNVMNEQRSVAEKGDSVNDRRRDILREIESCTKIRNFFESPNNVLTKQPSAVALLRVVETPKFKIQQEDIMNYLLKNKRDHTYKPQSGTFEIKSSVSPGCSPVGLQEKDHDLSDAEENTDAKRIAKFLLNSKSTVSKSNGQVELSNGCGEMDYPAPLKPTFVMEQDGEHSISGSSNAATDSENSEDDFHIKGCRKLEPLSPEIGITKHCLRSKRLRNKNDVDVTGCTQESESLKVFSPLRKETGNEERGKHQMCMEQDNEDGFASAVALLTVALDRVQTKIKSMTEKRSAEILMEAADGIYLQLEHAESQMEKDVEKLINHRKLKRRRLDARYQEKHEQLVGIRKRFESEVEQQLQGYKLLIEDLEKFGTELEGNMKRHKAANEKFLYLAEQTINGQLDDAERKILAAQELAREKMLQLKLVVAECVKHGAFGEIL